MRKTHRKEFMVEGKGIYEMLVKAINQEEEKYKNNIRDYIVDRIREVQIEKEEDTTDNRLYCEVVQGVKRGEKKNNLNVEEGSDKEIVVTNNKLIRSTNSLDTITEAS